MNNVVLSQRGSAAARIPQRRVVATASDATVKLTLSGRDLYGADLVATLSTRTPGGEFVNETIHFDALQDVVNGCASHAAVRRQGDVVLIADGVGAISLRLLCELMEAAFASWDAVLVSRRFARTESAA